MGRGNVRVRCLRPFCLEMKVVIASIPRVVGEVSANSKKSRVSLLVDRRRMDGNKRSLLIQTEL